MCLTNLYTIITCISHSLVSNAATTAIFRIPRSIMLKHAMRIPTTLRSSRRLLLSEQPFFSSVDIAQQLLGYLLDFIRAGIVILQGIQFVGVLWFSRLNVVYFCLIWLYVSAPHVRAVADNGTASMRMIPSLHRIGYRHVEIIFI